MEPSTQNTARIHSGYIILMDVETYDRHAFNEYLTQFSQLIVKNEGMLLFEGFAPEIIIGDWKPRNMLLILHFEKKESFQKFWISGENRALLYKYKDVADFKIVQIQSIHPK
ncbi:MAG: DUF1330 domain-containing protein [Bacteroidales bacterium]|nr:DUF1330 domain-containing protein [Bacteroidales bacterium]